MKPLQSIAMGLVIVVLVARFHGYDALPDPVGWLLVLLGVRALPPAVPHRDNLLRLAGLAGAVSVVVWFPAVTDALYDADASLAWAANLPEVLFGALLCHALAATADEGAMGSAGADPKAARWLRLTRTGMLVVAVLPVLVFGARPDGLRDDVLRGRGADGRAADLPALHLRRPELGGVGGRRR